ncbi:Membrane protein involved in the export of O-antigen and teichoic acid [Flavobacterium flevense]|uniref:Polysaccharide biosynthesis protein n=1 Tax=Flavobacterium flevense TaxID=983 RepID=A0A4Y4B0D7_9FLAO|nr:polysaccharide biosynthesis protein [Flavobacterium flevense]GEC72344.1 hypothetical protein FFL01_18830 [Flavobacterium flevense]SHM08036.1 Membrane protein involved in the export of O-antigen and teichoic acid [Flavobacterium flevense]
MLKKIKSYAYYDKTIQWGKKLSITGSAQVIIQAVGFASGILIIRLLSTQEYALYTLANTMLGTMIMLANGGISTGIMSIGAKVWEDKEKLGVVLETGLELRRKFAIGSLLVATPILIYLLVHNGASWLTTFLIVAALIPAFLAALSDSLLEVVPKLHQDIHPLQKNQIIVAMGRLLLNVLLVFLFPLTFIALLANGIPRIYGNIHLKKIAYNNADAKQKTDEKVKKELLFFVKRMLPETIFFCVSGQITIWILSIFGSTSSLASIGAIGKLSMVFNLFTVIFGMLIVPNFAKLKEDSGLLLKKIFYVSIGCIILSIFAISFTDFFSKELLSVLGNDYKDLNFELVLSIIGGCITFFQGCIFGLNNSRGWIINPLIYISVMIVVLIVGVQLIDVSTLSGVLYLNIVVASSQALMLLYYNLFRIFKIKNKSHSL